MNNTTIIPPINVILFGVYGVIGMVSFSLNLFIVVTIFVHQNLRANKSYYLLGVQSIVETGIGILNITYCVVLETQVTGFAFVLTSIYRLRTIITNDFYLTSAWQCFLLPQNILISTFSPVQPMALLVISIDRLIAVKWPLQYISLSIRYAYVIAALLVTYTALTLGAYTSSSYSMSKEATMLSICFWNSSVSTSGASMLFLFGFILSNTSVLAFLYVPYAYAKQSVTVKPLPSQSDTAYKRKMEFQIKLMKTVGLNVTATVILYVLPYTAAVISQIMLSRGILTAEDNETATYLAANIGNLNPVCNAIILIYRHSDLRNSFRTKNNQVHMTHLQPTMIK